MARSQQVRRDNHAFSPHAGFVTVTVSRTVSAAHLVGAQVLPGRQHQQPARSEPGLQETARASVQLFARLSGSGQIRYRHARSTTLRRPWYHDLHLPQRAVPRRMSSLPSMRPCRQREAHSADRDLPPVRLCQVLRLAHPNDGHPQRSRRAAGPLLPAATLVPSARWTSRLVGLELVTPRLPRSVCQRYPSAAHPSLKLAEQQSCQSAPSVADGRRSSPRCVVRHRQATSKVHLSRIPAATTGDTRQAPRRESCVRVFHIESRWP